MSHKVPQKNNTDMRPKPTLEIKFKTVKASSLK